MTSLAILWHFHQPEYRDPRTGRPTMPWTRLHTLRGYRDVVVEALEDRLPVTINLVPALLDQLLGYAQGGTDDHLDLTVRPAVDLAPHEVAIVRATFVCGNPRMRTAHPSYDALAQRVGSADALPVAQLRDLQVWSTLAWFGATAARDFPVVRELRAKGADFTEADKAAMLAVQHEIVTSIIPLFKRVAAGNEGPCLSTSPYHHPILPLLVDARHAKRSIPDLPDEVSFAWPEDALAQLRNGRERIARVLGVAPVGLWPSEGSLSPEVLPLIAEVGYRWVATDEGLLHRSERTPRRRGLGPWELGYGLLGFFRDHDLSDRVGFRYATMDPVAAAADLIAGVQSRAGDGDVLVVALDGENPWEAYADAGWAFRRALTAGLRRGTVNPVTLDAACQAPRAGAIRRLHTGSWINADFGIWIGHPDDRAGWRLLAQVRAAVGAAAPGHARDTAMEHIFAAEASDWFWWYGDEFSTPFAANFDALFRAHLRAALEAADLPVPEALHRPVALHLAGRSRLPWRWISPGADGSSHEGWRPAGRVDWGDGGSMARNARYARGFRYGWSRDGALWVRVEVVQYGPSLASGAGGLPREAAWRVTVDDQTVEVPADEGAIARDGTLSARVVEGDLLVKHIPSRGTPEPVLFSLCLAWATDASQWEPITLTPPDEPARAWWVA